MSSYQLTTVVSIVHAWVVISHACSYSLPLITENNCNYQKLLGNYLKLVVFLILLKTQSNVNKSIYSRICLIRHLKGIRKKWRIRQTGENSIIEARILCHSNWYTYIVLLFAVKYNFMSLWLNTTIDFSALYERDETLQFNQAPFDSLINFSALSQCGVGSRFEPRV